MIYINFLNKTNLTIFFTAKYLEPNKTINSSFQSANFFYDSYETLRVPEETKKISISIFSRIYNYFENQCKIEIPLANNLCYEIYKNNSLILYKKIDVKDLQGQDYIYFKNKTSVDIKAKILFVGIDNNPKKIESDIIFKNNWGSMLVPLNSTFIEFYILLKKALLWIRASPTEKFFSTPLKKCYEIKEKNILSNDIIFNTILCELDYIDFINKTNNKIKGNISYTFNNIKKTKESPVIDTGAIYKFNIPINTNTVTFSISSLNEYFKWINSTSIVNFSNHPIKKNYDIGGSLSNILYDEVNEENFEYEYIKFMNKTNKQIKGQLTYIFNKVKKIEETPIIEISEVGTFSILTNASLFEFVILTLNSDSKWIKSNNTIKFNNHPIENYYDIGIYLNDIFYVETKVGLFGYEYIKFINKTNRKIKGELTYTINKLDFKQETSIIEVGSTGEISVLSEAHFVKFVILGLNENATWIRGSNVEEISDFPIKKCYSISEYKLNFYFIEINCNKIPLL